MARRTTGIAGLLLTAALLTACGGDGEPDADSPGSSPSADAEATEDTAGPPTDSPTEESSEDASPDEPTAESTPTPPDTIIQQDEPAVVSLPHGTRGRGLYAIDLVGVERRPASEVPADLPVTGPSDLYYVTQDRTMLDVGTGSVNGMNLLKHTSVSIGDDIQITSVPFADFPRCRVQQFIPEDGDAGKTRRSCTAYLVPKGESIEQVWYFEFNSEFDYSTRGAPVRWQLDG